MVPVETAQQVGTGCVEKVEGFQTGNLVHQRQTTFKAFGHGDGHRSVEFDNGRLAKQTQIGVKARDLGPVGLAGCGGAGVFGGDTCLQSVAAMRRRRAHQKRKGLNNLAGIPFGAVLFIERDEVAIVIGAGGTAGILQEHQREESPVFGVDGEQFAEDAGETDGFGAEIGAH